jgi:CHAD domain-containing protein
VSAASPALDRVGIGPDEPLGDGLCRIAAGQFAAAIEALRLGADRDRGVHRARKSLKRLRALLRLAADSIGREALREENAVLRDAGRRLAPVRDGRVMIDTLDGIEVPAPEVRASLVDRHRAAAARVLADPQVMADLLTALRCSRERWERWSVDGPGMPEGFEAVSGGLRRVYRSGRRDFDAVRTGADGDRFHRWRKNVKYLRHQFEALRVIAPAELGGAIAYLDDLGEALGSEHDHDVLARLVAETPNLGAPEGRPADLITALTSARDRLRSQAIGLGVLLFGEQPKRFVAHLGELWEGAGRPRVRRSRG